MRSTLIPSLIASACLLAAGHAAAASVPAHPGVDQLPSCGTGNLETTCRVTVSNGDFSGYDGDDFYHGEFRWGSFNPRTHSITRHIVPWVYETEQDTTFLRGKARTRLEFPHPGDRVVQWIDLPSSENPTDVMYTLHVHVRGAKAEAGAGMGLFLYDGETVVLKAVTRQTARAGEGHPNQEFLGSLLVPAGAAGNRLALAIGVPKTMAGNLVIDDVVLVRSAKERILNLSRISVSMTVLLASGLSVAKADMPRHPDLGKLAACTSTAPAQPCRVAVANAHFAGPPDDQHTHGYQPQYFWRWPHAMAEHIVPWLYLDRCGTGYAQADADAAFVLKCPGDGIVQTLALLPVLDDVRLGYVAHAHVGTWSGHMDVRMDVELVEKGQVIALANATVQMRTPYRAPVSELSAWIDVPEGARPDAMRLSITSLGGWGQSPVDDVFVVRTSPDNYVPELQPQPIQSSRW
ncbi:hypothetical protein KCV01_g2508, partial [Aureobasidium melanogenum]